MQGGFDLRAMRRAIQEADEVVSWFGRHRVSTAENSWLLKRHNVRIYPDDLPEKFAAVLSPMAFRGLRSLSLSQHIPLCARRLVLLHEAGHLYMGTAEMEIAAYSTDDWRTPSELGADAFAAVGLIPTGDVDYALNRHIWMRHVEDELARWLMDCAEGLWEERRAVTAAQNRLIVREKLGV